ncbi:hypothetical protein EGT29_09735 [Pigmentiphaga sp. H8]|nr:hypothetical protein EGT29_09735 [Pigmentiphaga sp. H8]
MRFGLLEWRLYQLDGAALAAPHLRAESFDHEPRTFPPPAPGRGPGGGPGGRAGAGRRAGARPASRPDHHGHAAGAGALLR